MSLHIRSSGQSLGRNYIQTFAILSYRSNCMFPSAVVRLYLFLLSSLPAVHRPLVAILRYCLCGKVLLAMADRMHYQ